MILLDMKEVSYKLSFQGFTLSGKPAQVDLEFVRGYGFNWRVDQFNTLRIDHSLAQVKKRRIVLQYREHELAIVEHLMALRWAGLSCFISSDQLPYFATADEIWQKLSPELRSDCIMPIHWVRPARQVVWSYPGRSNTWVKIEPWKDEALEIDLVVDYPGLGKMHSVYSFRDKGPLLPSLLAARPLGWPRELKAIVSAARLLGWPHAHKFVWPQDAKRDGASAIPKEICDHRALDILGALALAHPIGLPACRYISRHAGHIADIEAISGTTWN